jgi:hypothetical protein
MSSKRLVRLWLPSWGRVVLCLLRGFAEAGVGYVTAMTDDDIVDVQLDPARATAARVTSRGLGMGQIEARRYLAELSTEDQSALADALITNVDKAQELAQHVNVPIGEYVGELVTKGEVGNADADLEVLYRAGFDVGFTACLVEAISTPSGQETLV